jgi:3-hydroxy-D-aspartate aldolase
MYLSQLDTPALYLDLDVFERNQKKLIDFLKEVGIAFRPHYKSTRCTTIAHMQIAAGAKGICCAKPDEAWDLAHAGIEDILIANQVMSRDKIAKVAALAGCCRLGVCVDDLDNIEALSAAVTALGTKLYVLVEYNVGANRCGANSFEEFHALAQKVINSPGLEFEGIQAYAGQLSHQKDYQIRKTTSAQVEQLLKNLIVYLGERGISVKEVSGVSTGSLGFRTKDSVYTEVQAGSYVFMDAAYNALNLKFENSLFVLSTVMKVTDEWIVVDTGRKSVSVDQAMPYIPGYENSPQMKVSEEHTKFPSSIMETEIGAKIPWIPGHCCTTMNLHDYIYFVRQGKVVDRVLITSRGHSR